MVVFPACHLFLFRGNLYDPQVTRLSAGSFPTQFWLVTGTNSHVILEDSAAPEAPVEELPVFKRQSFAWQQRLPGVGIFCRSKRKSAAARERLRKECLAENFGSFSDIWKQQKGVSKNSGTPKSSIFNRVFHYKPSILGYHYFWKPPNCLQLDLPNCPWQAPCTAIPKPEDTRRNPGGQIAVGWEMLDGKISLEAVENVLLNRDDGGNILWSHQQEQQDRNISTKDYSIRIIQNPHLEN